MPLANVRWLESRVPMSTDDVIMTSWKELGAYTISLTQGEPRPVAYARAVLGDEAAFKLQEGTPLAGPGMRKSLIGYAMLVGHSFRNPRHCVTVIPLLFIGAANVPAESPAASPEASPVESPAASPEASPVESPAASPEASPAESPVEVCAIARSGVTVTRLLCDPLPYKVYRSTARANIWEQSRFSLQYKCANTPNTRRLI
jgi:hypothetical protein